MNPGKFIQNEELLLTFGPGRVQHFAQQLRNLGLYPQGNLTGSTLERKEAITLLYVLLTEKKLSRMAKRALSGKKWIDQFDELLLADSAVEFTFDCESGELLPVGDVLPSHYIFSPRQRAGCPRYYVSVGKSFINKLLEGI